MVDASRTVVSAAFDPDHLPFADPNFQIKRNPEPLLVQMLIVPAFLTPAVLAMGLIVSLTG
jgi:hypothetical protein